MLCDKLRLAYRKKKHGFINADKRHGNEKLDRCYRMKKQGVMRLIAGRKSKMNVFWSFLALSPALLGSFKTMCIVS